MNLTLWLLAGSFAGWAGIRFFRANAARGLLTSMLIGVCGAYFGGSVLTPMLGDDSALLPDVVNPIALLMAIACSAVYLTVGEIISRRFSV